MSNTKPPRGKKAPARTAAPAPKRPRGRPPRITAQAIIDKTMELLATYNADEMNMAQVAASLATPTMSLYNYFPNYSALLDAVSDHAFSLFRFPASQLRKPWQDVLLAWLWALQRHCTNHPITFKIMSIEGHASSAWTKARAPVLQVLEQQGLEKQELAFAVSWFTSQAVGFMYSESLASSARQNAVENHELDELAPDDQERFRRMWKYLPRVKRDDVLDFGFRATVKALEELVPR